jgi:hypothetical protein
MEKNMDTKFDFNETGRFDFKQVRKRMPYTTPDGFFKDMEKNILEAVKDDTLQAVKIQPQSVKVQPKKRPVFKMIWAAAIAVAASVAVLLVLNIDFSAADSSLASSHSSQPSQAKSDLEQVDQAFAQLSEADQAYLLDVYQEDVFLNN